MLYNNSNGHQYEVIEYNTRSQVAILKPLNVVFEQAPYMVAKGFSLDRTSWDNGIYDLTFEEAQTKYNSFR
jgi:hypothetical protein